MVMDYRGTLDGEPFAGGEGATRWSSSAPAGSCPASRSSSRAPPPATSARSPSPSRTTTAPRSWPARRREFAVTVKEVKAKELPELDDDLAAEAGFDTLDELREDIRARLAEADEAQIEAGVPRGRARRRGRKARPSRSPRRSSRPARASCGTRCCTRSRTRASRARRTCGSPAATRTRSSSRASPTPSRRCGARRCWPAIVEAEGIEPTDEEVLEAVEQAAPPRRGHVAEEAARAPEVAGPARHAQGGPRPAQGDRPRRRVGEADLDRAGAGARQALDAGRRGRRSGGPSLWTPGS